MNDALYLGMDGGGTKTLAVVVDGEGRERARVTGGSSNYITIGREKATAHLLDTAARAVRAAGGSLPVKGVWLGVAGIDQPSDRDLLLPRLAPIASAIHLENDAELLLAALPDAVGVALVAGTGSIAVGRDAHGHAAHVAWWGHVLADDGSGYDLGHQALRAAVRAADGRGPQTRLLDLILREWHLTGADELVRATHSGSGTGHIARLAAVVFAAAEAGDVTARRIVRRGARELAHTVATIARKLDFAAGVPLALGGGLLLHQANYRELVLGDIRRTVPIAVVVVADDPALAAAQAARGLGGDNPLAINGRSTRDGA